MSSIGDEVKIALRESVAFGSDNKNKRFTSFFLNTMFLAIPGIILGHHIDRTVDYMKTQEILGKSIMNYAALQLTLDIIVVYYLSKTYQEYTMEFQNTYAGLFFVSLFFGMQVKLISNIQEVFL